MQGNQTTRLLNWTSFVLMYELRMIFELSNSPFFILYNVNMTELEQAPVLWSLKSYHVFRKVSTIEIYLKRPKLIKFILWTLNHRLSYLSNYENWFPCSIAQFLIHSLYKTESYYYKHCWLIFFFDILNFKAISDRLYAPVKMWRIPNSALNYPLHGCFANISLNTCIILPQLRAWINLKN